MPETQRRKRKLIKPKLQLRLTGIFGLSWHLRGAA